MIVKAMDALMKVYIAVAVFLFVVYTQIYRVT